MPRTGPKTPPAIPLIAALVLAGSFFIWRALAPARPSPLAQAQPLAQSAWRVLGPGPGPQGRDLGILATDLAWLRSQGVALLVVEGWLDDRPDPEALQRLASVLGQAPPVVLGLWARSGEAQGLPAPLKKQGYSVTLQGKRQALPAARPEVLPLSELLSAGARVGVLPQGGEPLAAVEMEGLWFNTLAVEAARVFFQLPAEALRYRWTKGQLSSLELKGRRFDLDGAGRLKAPPRSLPEHELQRLWQDRGLAAGLKGRAVFYRPWPQHLAQPQEWASQESLFSVLVEGSGPPPPPPQPWRRRGLALLGILAWGLAFLAWQRHRQIREGALALRGLTAPASELAWARVLAAGHWQGAVACLGPAHGLGHSLDDWALAQGALVILEAGLDRYTLALLPERDAIQADQAFAALRAQLKAADLAWTWGPVQGRQVKKMGVLTWALEGPALEKSLKNLKFSSIQG